MLTAEEEIERFIKTYVDRLYFGFSPRPDQPDRFDEQTSFIKSKHPGITLLLGGNGAGTTTCALMKAIRFMIAEQPAPRPGTPFWFISEGYPMVMSTCWAEKMCARGLLPGEMVQWDKISWYKPRQNWPFAVPLKPTDGSENYWTMHFMSYDQGRAKMQAQSIGGFCFVEQCPWELIEEVYRGCRDYNFVGNKIAEFTPIDPVLSAPLEEMLQEDRFPADWGIYRCNTTCAMEAGHVSKQWYNDFFGMISDDMREVRTTGAFASYEGLIYPRFQPKIHVLPDEEVQERIRGNLIHKRAIDWGSGPENAMVMIWAAKDSVGTWYVYDEYYSTDQGMTYTDHFNAMYDQQPWPEDTWYRQTYADPSDPGNLRQANNFLSNDGQHARTLRVTPALNSVLEGIEAVRNAMKTVHGEPRLFISKKCKNLIRQLQIYRWEKSGLSGMNPKDARPVPLKRDDHTCDSLRYLIFSDLVGARSGGISGSRIEPKNLPRYLRKKSTDS